MQAVLSTPKSKRHQDTNVIAIVANLGQFIVPVSQRLATVQMILDVLVAQKTNVAVTLDLEEIVEATCVQLCVNLGIFVTCAETDIEKKVSNN